MMYILSNRNYLVRMPKTDQAGRTLCTLWLKKIYPKELKYSQMHKVETDNRYEAGKLIERTL